MPTPVDSATIRSVRLGGSTTLPEIAANATPATLLQSVANNKAAILGKNKKISDDASAYLLAVANHPNANDEVKGAVKALVGSATGGAGQALKAWAASFRPGAASTGVGNVTTGNAPVVPPDNTGNAATTVTTNATAGIAGAMTGATVNALKLSYIHSRDPIVFAGEWKPSAKVLASVYGLGDANGAPTDDILQRFGRAVIVHNGFDGQTPGASFPVYHLGKYPLGDGTFGVRVLAVSDADSGNNASNKKTEGEIRKRMGVSEGVRCPFTISYCHLETNGPDGEGKWANPAFKGQGRMGTLADAAGAGGCAQNGFTHTGKGTGESGDTRNSPEGYHRREFEVQRYAAVAFGMVIKGTHPDTMATQLECAGVSTNDSVNFSNRDYKNDFVRIIDVNTTLMFARDWWLFRGLERGIITDQTPLTPELKERLTKVKEYLASDEWTTYCAEHSNCQDNLASCIDFSKKGFQEIYGEKSGEQLYDVYAKASTAAAAEHGPHGPPPFNPESLPNPETGERFQPVWKQMGYTAADVKPFASPEQYDQYHIALHKGPDAVAAYKAAGGVVPLPPGKALPFAPQTTADMIISFVEKFHPWREVGGFQATAAVMAFMKTAVERNGITPDTYIKSAAPVMAKMLKAQAVTMGAPDQFFAAVPDTLKGMFAKMIPEGVQGPERDQFVALFNGAADAIVKHLDGMKAQAKAEVTANRGPIPKEAAYVTMRKEIAGDLKAARELPVGDDEKYVKWNTAPGIYGDVVQGFHKNDEWNNGLISFVYLGHIMDKTEVEPNR